MANDTDNFILYYQCSNLVFLFTHVVVHLFFDTLKEAGITTFREWFFMPYIAILYLHGSTFSSHVSVCVSNCFDNLKAKCGQGPTSHYLHIRKTCPCIKNPLLYSKGYYTYFAYFCCNTWIVGARYNRLGEAVLTCTTIYVLSKNKKTIENFLLKIFISTTLKITVYCMDMFS